MNQNQRILLIVGALLVATLAVRPAYFGVDRESGGRVHAFIGYHWIWDPPSPAFVYEKLTGRDPAGVDPQRLGSFEARINTVRWIGRLTVLGVVIAVLMTLLRTRTKESAAPGH